MTELIDRVERRLSEEHTDVVDGIERCADAVADEWDESPEGAWTTDRDEVVPVFERALDASGLLMHFPRVLSDLVTTIGHPMPAPPVAAPPHVVVRSEGVLLRASLREGRLVVAFDAFAVERGDELRYVRLDDVDVTVELR
ncbi:hypothetical protein GL213_07075 [Halogeometricum borinquense]|uniref:DUF7988 domain-containing protein n=2 Tax=Halogeometricum borinquense TaxID=60847 RepID=E4NT04_HALBP|nr:hypothetical protein [Halogeometricum borinquense]ADQ66997.1 hypothetical protein Hbor_14170 [Halogeometricum borinquense DSM 11551]ELY29789.1 hypothetical protein C499_04541 [Halogeometricum borinquense DSM 11551]QIB74745.1 hypothetical protein G3I44_10885 [Halogeometricum borinquense]QIQ76300.1 hypothetical protein GL213_07075 [Halogeometricum borinquense]RYJ14020.1 hypothetical protein ELS19_08605 [Halogeometricum borinquense]